MTNAEKQTLAERISAMTIEEKLFILRFIPSNFLTSELSRRCNSASNMLNKMNDVLCSINQEPTLEEMQEAILEMREILK